jgi:acyl-CoA synthetase (AMP-forming)/AMP-acid ligase II
MALIETQRMRPKNAANGTVLRDWVRALEATAPIAANPQRLLCHVIDELARTQADAPALLSAGENFSYGALAARANRFARWALDQGLARGDSVCLMMPNRPEYMAVWLGLSSVGVIVALINTQLRAGPLRIASTSPRRSTLSSPRNMRRRCAPSRHTWRAVRKSGRTATRAVSTSALTVWSMDSREKRSRRLIVGP